MHVSFHVQGHTKCFVPFHTGNISTTHSMYKGMRVLQGLKPTHYRPGDCTLRQIIKSTKYQHFVSHIFGLVVHNPSLHICHFYFLAEFTRPHRQEKNYILINRQIDIVATVLLVKNILYIFFLLTFVCHFCLFHFCFSDHFGWHCTKLMLFLIIDLSKTIILPQKSV